MFKVECPGCKAPYQVDERRIPSSGLQMRCPKCGTSFKVDPATDVRRSGTSQVLGGALGLEGDLDSVAPASPGPQRVAPNIGASAAVPPRPRVDLKGTMMGVAPGSVGLGPPRPGPPAPVAVAPVVPAASALQAQLRGTMMGVAPGAPGAVKPPPVPPRRVGPEAAPSPGPAPTSAYDEADLPAVGLGSVARAPSFTGTALPAVAPPRPVSPAAARPGKDPMFLDIDLPSTAGANASASSVDLDLHATPMPRAGSAPELDLPATPGGRGVSLMDLDLPTTPGERAPSVTDLDLPAAAVPRPPLPKRGRGDDLPALPMQSSTPFAIDLPDVAGIDLPSVGIDLPSVSGVDLPSPGFAEPSASLGIELDYGLGLPSASGASLPSVARAGTPGGGGPGLPSLIGAGLPAAARVGLPSVAQSGLPSLSGAGLPSVGGAGLPSVGGAGLPSPSPTGLPVVGGPGLPSPLPTDHFGAPPERRKMASLAPDFGMDPQQPARRSHSPGEFGELDLPGGAAPVSGGFPGEGADPFGEAPIPSRSGGSWPKMPAVRADATRTAADDALVREGGGGVAYGQVNLEGMGSDADLPIEAGGDPAPRGEEDMEFGGVPQENQPRSLAPAAQVQMNVSTALPEIPGRRRRWAPRLYAGMFIVLVGGAALALVPYVGPFGAYWITDQLRAGEYQRLIADTAKSARASMAEDTFPAATRAVAAVESARAEARRVRPLAAYAAFCAYAEELRFGSDGAAHARASVLLDELAEHDGVEYLALARTARAAADGQLARARQLLDSVSKGMPAAVEIAVLRGELELRARDPKAALLAWNAASVLERSARTSYGLARAHYAADDIAGATALLRDVIGKNPAHVGARILLARIESSTRSGEAEATRMLDSIAKQPDSASPEEIVSAETLLGDIHLSRSRMSLAEAAYSQALKINPKAARALNGLGDALYRAGRYSEAQARFEASTQADPDDLSAKIGVAKAKLALERVEDARVLLKKLRETYPQSVAVSYWYGRVLEALGNRREAEAVYQEAQQRGPTEPLIVDVYIALAMIQNQQGRTEDAQKTLAEARARLPNLPAIHKALGDVALSQGRYAEAVQEFQSALELDPEDLASKFRLGTGLRRDGKFDESSKVFDQVGSVDAEYPGLALERGLLYEASGKSEQALAQYETALAKAPNDPDLMLRVGCGKVSAGHAQQAEELLRKVLSQRPISAETNHCLGRALLLEGTRLADALRLLDRATELDPNRAEYFLYVGWAANEAGNVPKAERALGEALRLDQGLADAYWQRGVLRQRQGAVKDAINDLTRALTLRPSRYEAHAALADAYYDLGKESQSLAEWQIAVQAEPDNATWRFRYGKLLSANHMTDAARVELTKALELAQKAEPEPRWTWEAHNLLARAIGLRPEAIKHWEEFLRLGPRDSPYRPEAKSNLEKLGHPWNGD